MTGNDKDNRVVTLNATIRPDQMKSLDRYTEQRGFITRSEALRFILDRWQDHEKEQRVPDR